MRAPQVQPTKVVVVVVVAGGAHYKESHVITVEKVPLQGVSTNAGFMATPCPP